MLDSEPDKGGTGGSFKDKPTEDNLKEAKSTKVTEIESNAENKDINNLSNESSGEPEDPKWIETSDGQIEVEDSDDYLIYLEDILKRIHKQFYDMYDSLGQHQIPDLKFIIPEVKGQVLAGTSLVFSGLVPTHQKLETSRAFLVARGLGAEVTQDFTEKTTHLVAVRSGTAKVNTSRRMGEGKSKVQVVTPDWLWSCAERWERVDERLYPLQRGGQSSARRPPAHCSSPPPAPPPNTVAAIRKRTPSGRFMDTINPLLSFSSDDIADMDREVEDIFNESDESSSEEEKAITDDIDDEENIPEDRLLTLDTENSSQDRILDNDVESESEPDEDRPRKRPRPASPPTEDDDSSWNLMGAALEREFLAQD
ncbi:RNA polymerase II subunit A C-terminal domain phosphatase isoform X2 [Leptidea sinapis]|nr:RNA polymerase II subunit A C-terminal domain phosphatase isoform X2 [Leptidea sinapis]